MKKSVKKTTKKQPRKQPNTQSGWASVAQAQSQIMAGLSPAVSAREMLPLAQALGRVLAADILAPFNVPGHDNSAMDGYACRFKDLPEDAETPLRLVGRAFAGAPYNGKPLAAGECVRIMTGATIPPAANVVVPQEETRAAKKHKTRAPSDESIIILPAKRRHGLHIRKVGEDLRAHSIAVRGGTLCRAAHIGLLGSLGLVEVPVFRRLRVAFFSTGDEVKTAGQELREGDVYDSNRRSIAAMIQRMGLLGLDLGVVADSPKSLAAVMDTAAESADVIIASGGASVGEADYIRPVLAERGKVLFWKVAMRPGRPLAYGKVRMADFFGLPGNPVSVMVCFYQFVVAALWHRAGRQDYAPPPLFAVRTAAPLKKSAGRTEYQRGFLRCEKNGEWRVYPTGNQGSGILSSMTAANCFIVLEDERGNVAVGDKVQVQMFDGLV